VDRRWLVAWVLGGLVLAGCTPSHPAGGPGTATPAAGQLAAYLHAAPGQTAAAKTASVTGTTTATVEGSVEVVRETGVVNFTTKQTRLAIALPAVGTPQMVVDDGIVYMELSALAPYVGSKPWLKIDPSELSQANSPLAALFREAQSESSDPVQQMQLLDGAVTGTVVDLGPAPVDGAATTHYRFTSDLDAVRRSLPAGAQPQFQQLLGALGSRQATVDAWIDAGRLIHQLTVSMAVPPGASPPASPAAVPVGPVTSTIDFSNFGAPVAITAPDPAQVTDVSQLLGELGRLTPTPSP
jgi:hypothetical protein